MHKLIQQDSVSLGYTEQMHRSISCCDKISVLTHEAYKNMRLKQAHELLHRTTRDFEKIALQHYQVSVGSGKINLILIKVLLLQINVPRSEIWYTFTLVR